MGNPTPQCRVSTQGSYSCHRITLILLPWYAKCFFTLSISKSLGSSKPYPIWIQLITANVMHPYKTLLSPLSDWLLSLFIHFILYLNRFFSIGIGQVTSTQVTKTKPWTKNRQLTAEYVTSCLHDAVNLSVSESESFDDANKVASEQNCSQGDGSGCRLCYTPI